MFFPVKDFTEEQRIAGTYPYTSAVLCGNQIYAIDDACSMAWWCSFLTARPSQDSRAIAEK